MTAVDHPCIDSAMSIGIGRFHLRILRAQFTALCL